MELIDNDLVLLDQSAENKDEVIHMLADLAESAGRLNDKALYIEELYHREAEAPTNIGFSTAIPHGRTDAVKDAALMFIRLNKEIPWNEDQVHMIFGIAVPESVDCKIHLAMLAKVARKLMKEELRDALDAASTCDEVVALLKD
jgi:PTS system fructose-specific IIA component